MSEKMMYVRFEKETGDVLGISGREPAHETSIPVPLADVMPILDGIETADSFEVKYNPKTKQFEFASRYDTKVDGDSVNDFIYEVPEEDVEDPDILIVQDIPNTCWKIFIGKTLLSNLRNKGVNISHKMMLSITDKGDPNILYKTLFVDVGQVIRDNYVVLPMTTITEIDPHPISIFTSRRFDTYQFKRILHEQN